MPVCTNTLLVWKEESPQPSLNVASLRNEVTAWLSGPSCSVGLPPLIIPQATRTLGCPKINNS